MTEKLCPTCNKMIPLKRPNQFKQHCKRHPQCPSCEIRFDGKHNLYIHMLACMNTPLKCTMCHVMFYSTEDYDLHFDTCNVCRASICKKKMGRHLQTRHFQCECKRWFNDEKGMHMHQGQLVKCTFCESQVLKCILMKHTIDMHPGEEIKEEKKNKVPSNCVIVGCKYISTSETAMQNHMDCIHLCSHCHVYFVSLERHIESTHSLQHNSGYGNNLNTNTNWVTIKCEDHKDERIEMEILKACGSCKQFRIYDKNLLLS